MRVALAFLMWLLVAFTGVGGQQSTVRFYYVSTTGNDSNPGTLAAPFLTLGHARTTVQTALSGGVNDIVVYVRGGMYTESATAALTSADSPPAGHNVTWASYPGEQAILSGGVQVSGWAICTTADSVCNSGDGTTYQATVSSPTDFREFYFCPDGTFSTCMHRPVSHTTSGFLDGTFTVNTANGAVTSPGGAPFNAAWANPTDVEVVYQNMWLMPRCKATTVTGNPTVFALQTPCATTWAGVFYNFYIPDGVGSYLWAIENAYELMTAQTHVGCGLHSGCWYYNRTTHVLYYQPKTGENMATAISFVPNVDKLLTGVGVSNLTFERITFAFSTWLGPNQSGNGYMPTQSGAWCTVSADCNAHNASLTSLNGALDFSSSSHDLTFSHNLFAHNAARAMLFQHGTQTVTLMANDFEDNGGGGVQYGDVSDGSQATAGLQTCCLTLRNNKFNSGGGWQYMDAGEFFHPFGRNLIAIDNEFDSVGWVPIATDWGGWTAAATYAGSLTINNNYINGYCLAGQLFDCGGIYNINSLSGTNTANGNYIKGLGASPNLSHGGIYPDQGTSNLTMNGNVIDGPLTANRCANTAHPQGGCGIFDYNALSGPNNITTGTWYSTSANNLALGTGDSISAPTTFTSGSPPAGATNIINAAGIQAGITPGP